jgi:septum site-determining protein MinC
MATMHAEAPRRRGGPALEVKGTIAPVTVICLRSIDLEAIEAELRARTAPAPQLFQDAPVVIDLADVEETEVPLTAIAERVRRCRLLPIGVAHLPGELAGRAVEAGLPVLQLGFGRSKMARLNSEPLPAPAPAPAPAPEPAPPRRPVEKAAEPVPTLTVRQPVRGGQVVYAQKGDLVVIGQVNPGAQVIADGHVHIYGRLSGRALAGASGNQEARLFCQSLEAELVSVAGAFLTADDIPAELRGRPAQVFAADGMVKILSL